MKRKGIKMTLIVVSVLAIIVAVIALGISPFAKSYIEKHSKELIGRKVLMKDLRLNVFTGTLRLDSLRMYEANDSTVFASVDTFFVDLQLLPLISSKVEIAQLKVIRPYAAIIQKGEKFNFDDLMPKEDSVEVKKEPSSFPQSIVIKNIYIGEGKLVYTDLLLDNTIRMNDLGVAIPELAFEKGNTNAGIHLKVGDDATLNSKLSMNMQTSEYDLNLQLGKLPISIIKPYLKEYLNMDKLEGTVNSNLSIRGNTNHVMEFTISGTAEAQNFNLTNHLGEPIVAIREASVKINKIHLPTSTYLFDYVNAQGVKLNYIMHPQTDNVSALLKPEDAGASQTDSAASVPMNVKIEKMHIANSQIEYTDRTLKASTFTLPVSGVDFQSEHFNLNGTNAFKAKASLPQGGRVEFNWKGNMNDLKNQEIMANFQNVSLALFSPYCLDYTAYDITGGNMNFVTRNHIKNNNINSLNNMDVYNMTVGKKHKEMKVEYNVPLKLGLYILKDKDGKINFDIPVKGNLDNPEFSYKKIIFKTIVNLMVKVAVSPVRFLANSLGMSPDKMESMPVDALQTGINAQQYSQLNDLGNLYRQKPDMTVVLTQWVDWEEALSDYSLYLAKQSFLKSQIPNQEVVTFEDTKELKENDEKFVTYVQGMLTAKGATVALDAPLKEKLQAVFVADSVASGLLHKLQQRNQLVQEYLTNTCNIPAAKLSIQTATADSLQNYDGSAKYKIDMQLPNNN